MKPAPIFASETTAARLLDMTAEEFRNMVAAGHLPPPLVIGKLRRFDIDELRRVIRGDAAVEALTW